ncbi:hypothetical protein Tco_0077207 [Tanacetum coccineum]
MEVHETTIRSAIQLSTPSTPTGGSTIEMSTQTVWFKISATGGVRMRGSGVRMRGGHLTLKGVGVRMKVGGVMIRGLSNHLESTPIGSTTSEAGSSGLKTINGKLVRNRGKKDGSRAYMYPGGIKPIGFGVSWDPLDEETITNMATWNYTRRFYSQSQSEIPLTQSQPLASQEPEPEPVIEQEPMQEQVFRKRELDRIKQLMFNRTPSSGPGLTLDDAISLE